MKKLSHYYVIAMALFMVACTLSTPYAAGMARLNFHVVDENNQAIEGAQVRVQFQGGGLDRDRTVGTTDNDGMFSSSGFSRDGSSGGGVFKDGYYKSAFHHDFYVTRLGLWQPWGKELTVVMRPIVNPVPMYVLDWGSKIPAFGKSVGFDLVKADWVIPYGQGTHADFIFNLERQYDDTDNFVIKMTLTFLNPLDGLQVVKDDGGGDFNAGSSFRLPRMAPLDGYQQKFQRRLTGGKYGWFSDEEVANNYIFRIRSEVDGAGNLQRAMYGKIRGDIEIYTSGAISMLYYLNPDYTRNLEFDIERNLFSPLPRGVRNVRLP